MATKFSQQFVQSKNLSRPVIREHLCDLQLIIVERSELFVRHFRSCSVPKIDRNATNNIKLLYNNPNLKE